MRSSEAGTFRDRMSEADALIWNIEADPILRSTIVTICLLDRAPAWDDVRRRVEAAIDAIPRLRQRVMPPRLPGPPPRWVDDRAFRLERHLHHLPLDGAPFDTVLELAAVAAETPFDRSVPLWEMTVVDGLEGGKGALVVKLHHAMTDGVGGVALAALLFDLERHPRAKLATHAPTADAAAPTPPSGSELRRAVDAARWLASRPARALTADGRRAAERGARSILKLLAPMSSPMSPVMLGRSPQQRFTVFDVDLDDLRGAARACDASINDVFLAAVTGGLRRYHEEHGAPVDELRIDLPISIRGDDDAPGGNRFVPTRFALPVGEKDPRARVRSARSIVRQWRDEPALQWTELLAGVLNRLPRPLLVSLFGGMLKNVDFVATNVPGFPMPVYFAGAKVLRQYAFAPPTGAAVNVALMSHGPHACIGVVFDHAAVPDAGAFTQRLREGFAEVTAIAHRPRARHAS